MAAELVSVRPWHTTCSRVDNFKKDWLPGVAGPEPRLGFRFWGVNYKEGACTSPLFAFLRTLLRTIYFESQRGQPPILSEPSDLQIFCTTRYADKLRQPKKVSGRWGFRPLGRGGWRETQSEAGARLSRDAALASSRTLHRSSLGPLRKPRPTPDYSYNFAPHPLRRR